MSGLGGTRIRKLQRSLRLRGPIIILSVGVILPVLLTTSVGIISLVVAGNSYNLVFGVLVISFTAAAIGGAVLATVLLGRKARTARLQADFIANLSHELRTPLSAIRMYAQTLEMGMVDESPQERKRCIETIIRETEWLDAMIDRLLTWRSLAKDRTELDPVCRPLNEVIRDTASRFQKMFGPEEIDFSVSSESESPVWHDERGIHSIVLNLLTNAAKYSKSPKRISLELSESKEHVIVSVADNGMGIPEEEKTRIFEPFYRIETSDDIKTPGAGLGLAIVNHLVQAHRGILTVSSNEMGGSTFKAAFPIVQGGS